MPSMAQINVKDTDRRKGDKEARSVDSASHPTAKRRRSYVTFDSFVVGDSNQVASTTAQSIATRLGKYSPLYFYGPSGCGKTHLLEAICSDATQKIRGVRRLFLSAEQFTTQFVDALRGTGLPSFRRKYRGVQLLVVDDIQFLSGKEATLVEFQHTFDSLLREGQQLVFTADRPTSPVARFQQ